MKDYSKISHMNIMFPPFIKTQGLWSESFVFPANVFSQRILQELNLLLTLVTLLPKGSSLHCPKPLHVKADSDMLLLSLHLVLLEALRHVNR